VETTANNGNSPLWADPEAVLRDSDAVLARKIGTAWRTMEWLRGDDSRLQSLSFGFVGECLKRSRSAVRMDFHRLRALGCIEWWRAGRAGVMVTLHPRLRNEMPDPMNTSSYVAGGEGT
jgi:hypothetical protein